jgi:hypothetical protein
MLFDETVNSHWFTDIPFILVLNKADMLPAAMSQVSFRSVFPDYTGSDYNCLDAILYYKNKLIAQYHGTEKNKIFPVMMSVVDTESMAKGLELVRDVVIRGKREDFQFDLWDPGHVQILKRKPFLMSKKLIKFSDVDVITCEKELYCDVGVVSSYNTDTEQLCIRNRLYENVVKSEKRVEVAKVEIASKELVETKPITQEELAREEVRQESRKELARLVTLLEALEQKRTKLQTSKES